MPKFRDGSIEDFDINNSDDCLIRYLGYMDDIIDTNIKKLKNPIIWFKEGIHEIMSYPLIIFSWFGIVKSNTVSKVMSNSIYKIITGIIALIMLLSSIVTIIQGKEATIQMIDNFLNK